MAENEELENEETTEVTYIPVSLQEVCDYMGFEVSEVEEDAIIKRNIVRLINFSNLYLQIGRASCRERV